MENKEKETTQEKKDKTYNLHKLLPYILGLIILIIAIIGIIQLLRWNKGREFIIDEDIDVSTETEDLIYFMNPKIYNGENDDGELKILMFGNDTLAYDRGGTNIGELLAEKTGATVYNCALEGSYLSCDARRWDQVADHPIDAFSFFWLSDAILSGVWDKQENAIDNLPESYDKEQYMETLEMMKTIDCKDIDLLIIYYDGHDYLASKPTSNIFNMYEVSTQEGSYIGSLERYIANYPNMQYMFVAPTFCYAYDENGNREGCDIADLGYGNLPTCLTTLQVQSQNFSVSYLDNFYGIKINAETADKYLLSDGIIPNNEGREMIAERIAVHINLRMEQE